MMTFISPTAAVRSRESSDNAELPVLCRTRSCAALVVDHLAEQGWGRLADGTIVWDDDHRVAPTSRWHSTSEPAEP